jgi:hypothetical protein
MTSCSKQRKTPVWKPKPHAFNWNATRQGMVAEEDEALTGTLVGPRTAVEADFTKNAVEENNA